MVKVEKVQVAENAKISALGQENILLRKKLKDTERLAAEQAKLSGGNLTSEINKIRSRAKPQADSVSVVISADHKNISIWTKEGKRIGPMHPDNAIQTLNRFAELGILLLADQPTAAQIEAYKQTPEYKILAKKESIRRAIKDKSRRAGQMEKLSAEIAKQTGTTVEALNQILRMSEVRTGVH